MAKFLHPDRQQNDAAFDAAVIRVDQLQALAGLLSLEEVAEQFSGLDLVGQVSIFGLFEAALSDVRAALARAAHNESADDIAR
ncbi:hypothetical protein HHL24_14700 [Paraburkholderia sp. RP-4-7]|jgi:hypothetical protein|uniref:Uncharacterized protein n=1 Tax=Paraburkholderia polaris TaxID=2728848 RepID=A0A848IHR3_9BURK|nr:hypothetical protein [Paraburkholderia polaris]NML99183.1 hypothetical protein [Paraburkholderia polaris]